jgi:hypothetical protein
LEESPSCRPPIGRLFHIKRLASVATRMEEHTSSDPQFPSSSTRAPHVDPVKVQDQTQKFVSGSSLYASSASTHATEGKPDF